MHNRDMAKEWIKAALLDMEVIEEIIDNSHLTAMSVFHAQQLIEKALKAVLEYYYQDVPKIHQIKKLLDLTDKYITFDTDRTLVSKIDKLYIDSRYPGELGLLPYGKPTLEDAREFYEFAEDIFERVCGVLGIDRSEVAQ